LEKFFSQESAYFSHELLDFLNHRMILMPNWKWIALFSAIILLVILRPLIQWSLKEIKQHIPLFKKYPKSFGAYLSQTELERPLAWILVLTLLLMVSDGIELSGNFQKYYDNLMHAFMAFNLIRLCYFGVDALGHIFEDLAAKTESTYDDQLVPFATKSLKVLVIVLGFLIILQNFGLNVMSLLAGLGLGGLALALAAQDTAANLFGSITILIDHPFKIGDWVKIKDMEGTVEEIGFRSTRIRTFYNSVITIPNAMMAKETIDNMGERPARRIRQNVGITYETPPEKIEQFIDSIKYLIRQEPKVRQDTITVAFNAYQDSALNILINFHAEVSTSDEELGLQQKVFIEIIKLAASMKVDFAYPTQTVYYKGGTQQ
jgi:MscS family membrane protein